MTDDEWIENIRKIEDPRELLKEIRDNWDMLATDHYYEKLTSVLYEQIEIVIKERNKHDAR